MCVCVRVRVRVRVCVRVHVHVRGRVHVHVRGWVQVNRNASFLPHVDSGRGAGQSVSMIYGLGDYVGGAISVEGSPSDIRYVPLEFDGWRQRHWTEAYEGERYSLVWFTPE